MICFELTYLASASLRDDLVSLIFLLRPMLYTEDKLCIPKISYVTQKIFWGHTSSPFGGPCLYLRFIPQPILILVYFTLKTLCCCLFDCNFNLIALLQNRKGVFNLLDNNFKYFLI